MKTTQLTPSMKHLVQAFSRWKIDASRAATFTDPPTLMTDLLAVCLITVAPLFLVLMVSGSDSQGFWVPVLSSCCASWQLVLSVLPLSSALLPRKAFA